MPGKYMEKPVFRSFRSKHWQRGPTLFYMNWNYTKDYANSDVIMCFDVKVVGIEAHKDLQVEHSSLCFCRGQNKFYVQVGLGNHITASILN